MSKEQVDFLTRQRLLDNLKTELQPSSQVADVLANILRDEDYARYFFRDLDNPAWLLPLSQRGVFSRPPSPVPADGGWRFPHWPAARYLQRLARDHPSDVAAIIREMECDNPVVCSELVEALLAMPPTFSATLVSTVLEWLELPTDILLSDRVIGLIRHLAEGSRWKSALRLLSALIEPEMPKPRQSNPYFMPEVRPRRDAYAVERTLTQLVPSLAKLRPDAVLQSIEGQLKRALRLEEPSARRQLRSGLSLVWRPAIEDHEQDWRHGYKSQLVSALRDVLEQLSDSSVRTEATLRRYSRSRRSVFRRLCLHRARLGGKALRQLRRGLLMNPKFDSDLDCHHELYMLRAERFADLTKTERRLLIERMIAPPKRRRAERDDDYERRSKAILVQRLGAIETWLPPDIKDRYEGAVREQGKAEHPEFLMYHSGGWVGPTSPKGADDLSQMTPEEVVEFLKTWSPEEGFPSEESRLGLARTVEGVVQANPGLFIAKAYLFADPGLRGLYVQHMINGIREAVKSGSMVDWEKLIDFCEELLASSLRRYDQRGDPENTSWGSGVASSIADLFTESYKAADRAPESYLWERNERILYSLAQDPEPDEAYEAQYGGSNMDPFTLSLNTARGKAMHAVFSYVRHVVLTEERRRSEEAVTEEAARRLRPSIREFLEAKLDKKSDPSEAVHSVFGVHLPLLLYADRDWTLQMLPRILPSSERYWWAAFEAFIMYGQFQAHVYRLLESEYRRAMEEAQVSRPRRPRYATFEEQLGKHLALVFWHGLENIEDPNCNLSLFFREASDEARSSFVWLVWRALEDVKPDVDSAEWKRCKALWEHRSAAASASPTEESFLHELASYAWWLTATPEHVGTMRDLILAVIPRLQRGIHAGYVIAYLDREAQESISEAMELLRALVESGRELYLLTEHRDRMRQILKRALASGHADAESNALRVINHYERIGDYGYRDLVE